MTCPKYEQNLAKNDGFIPVSGQRTKFDKYKRKIKGKLYKFFTSKEIKHERNFSLEAIKKVAVPFDAIIDISGFSYSDDWGYKIVDNTNRLMNIFAHKGTKFIFMPQAWGSFNDAKVADVTRKMLTKADKFYARDYVSHKYLMELLHEPQDKIPVLPDIAIIFKYESANQLNLLKELKYTNRHKLKVAVSPNMRMFEKSVDRDGHSNYINLLTDTIVRIKANYDADIFLIPNEIRPEGLMAKDDRYLCHLIFNSLDNKDNCYNFNKYHNAEGVRSIIGQMDLLIGSRYHALIFALSQNVPSIALSWSHKYEELFSLYGIDDYVITQNEIENAQLYNIFETLARNRKLISKQLNVKNSEIQKEIVDMFDSMSLG